MFGACLSSDDVAFGARVFDRACARDRANPNREVFSSRIKIISVEGADFYAVGDAGKFRPQASGDFAQQAPAKPANASSDIGGIIMDDDGIFVRIFAPSAPGELRRPIEILFAEDDDASAFQNQIRHVPRSLKSIAGPEGCLLRVQPGQRFSRALHGVKKKRAKSASSVMLRS